MESPDFQMDISDAGTVTTDNISTSSASPTISTQAEIEISNGEKIVEKVTKNMNSLQLTSSMKENLENQNILSLDTTQQHQTQKLTPVRHHPLMFDDDVESEDSCNNSHSNFPDVVLAHHQPLRLSQPAAKNRATTDLVNSVNNNYDAKNRRIIGASNRPIYREPSPVSELKFKNKL